MVGQWKQIEITIERDASNQSHIVVLGGQKGRRIIETFLRRCEARKIPVTFSNINIRDNYEKLNYISEREFSLPLTKFLPQPDSDQPPLIQASTKDEQPQSDEYIVATSPTSTILESESPDPRILSPTLLGSDIHSPMLNSQSPPEIDIGSNEIPFSLMDATDEELLSNSPFLPSSPTGIPTADASPEELGNDLLEQPSLETQNPEQLRSWIEVLRTELGLESIEKAGSVPGSIDDILEHGV
ncbi:hypothetical protein ABW19_dt0204831 [Dactylella cylindrospora]|nr:hypothetical protein ABW19_dt0204831 [Dactylella cylindrospora]